MGGCYNAQLGAGMPNTQKQEPPAPPAAAPAAEGAAGYRRRVKRRRAAFGASKSVSCDATLFDVIKSMFQKPQEVACTLSTLHKVFHGVILAVIALRIAVEVVAMVLKLLKVPSGLVDNISKRTIPVIMLFYLAALLAKTANSKKTTTSQRVSSIIEVGVALIFYAIPIAQSAFGGVPVLEKIVEFLNTLSSAAKDLVSGLPLGGRVVKRLGDASRVIQ